MIKSNSRKKHSITLIDLDLRNISMKITVKKMSICRSQIITHSCHSLIKKQSTFVPPNGRDTYLDFYIEAVTQEILQASPKRKLYSNISKEEMESLRSLSQDDSIVIRKADKSNMIVIMNKTDYIKEKKR